MTTFHHCSKTFSRKFQIIKIQYLHSTTAANHTLENYKLYKFNDSISPLRQTILHKISNYTNSMTPFHLRGKPLQRNIQIIQNYWLYFTAAAWHALENYKLYKIQSLNSTSAVMPYIEKYKSYNINDYITPLRQDFSWKLQIIKIQ